VGEKIMKELNVTVGEFLEIFFGERYIICMVTGPALRKNMLELSFEAMKALSIRGKAIVKVRKVKLKEAKQLVIKVEGGSLTDRQYIKRMLVGYPVTGSTRFYLYNPVNGHRLKVTVKGVIPPKSLISLRTHLFIES